MASATRSAATSLTWLASILALIAGSLAFGIYVNNQEATPGLALDLAGGTQIILAPEAEDGSEITQEVLDQTVEIIRRRVDASGVAEAEITTQGVGSNPVIVVGLPGNPDDDTKDLVRQAAQLQFRPALYFGGPQDVQINLPADIDAARTEGTASDYSWITPELEADFAALDCTTEEAFVGGDGGDPDAGFVSCNEQTVDGVAFLSKVVLGPVELDGSEVADANAAQPVLAGGTISSEWIVQLEFTGEGATRFDTIAERLFFLTGDRNRFGIVLDGVVISAPSMQAQQFFGQAQISGGFENQDQAVLLANQLKFGALPLSLETQSEIDVGATLGEQDLERGLIAGGIGLLLVVLYSLIQYRALGFITVFSLGIAGALTYGVITLLSWGLGYRLSLAGVAGLIVAIGITADSFIVYFERVRDELRDGRSLPAAVEHAWKRARRTILASDTVSLLAAIVLYFAAVGGVRGFAFTLGLTTLIDIVVVFLFTHPALALLAKTRFFGNGHPLSGFDPRQLGREAIYQGRGRVKTGPTLAEKKAVAEGGKA